MADESDVRSSFRCEVFATEFEIQGLELDWIGLCWGGDFIWDESEGWQLRAFRHVSQSKWTGRSRIAEKRTYRRNAYRVLLTRARQGMIIFVPEGRPEDPTNLPEEFEATANYLLQCGIDLLPLPLSFGRNGGHAPSTLPPPINSAFLYWKAFLSARTYQQLQSAFPLPPNAPIVKPVTEHFQLH